MCQAQFIFFVGYFPSSLTWLPSWNLSRGGMNQPQTCMIYCQVVIRVMKNKEEWKDREAGSRGEGKLVPGGSWEQMESNLSELKEWVYIWEIMITMLIVIYSSLLCFQRSVLCILCNLFNSSFSFFTITNVYILAYSKLYYSDIFLWKLIWRSLSISHLVLEPLLSCDIRSQEVVGTEWVWGYFSF